MQAPGQCSVSTKASKGCDERAKQKVRHKLSNLSKLLAVEKKKTLTSLGNTLKHFISLLYLLLGSQTMKF